MTLSFLGASELDQLRPNQMCESGGDFMILNIAPDGLYFRKLAEWIATFLRECVGVL